MARAGGRAPAPLAWALSVAVSCAAGPVMAQDTRPPPGQPPSGQAQPAVAALSDAERAEVARMMQELVALKAAYSQEVRRLRELDMQMQALQARISGRVPPAPEPAPAVPTPPPTPAPTAPVARAPAATPPEAGYASTAEDAARAREEEARSGSDVRQQQQALFNQRLVIDNGFTYN
ncbi:MAG: hypothetical protein GX805_06310, partial [Gammaproteobacteria bacterium]|nr:hypothetical protein [Gammaproteobacteria bacterium]